MTCSLNGYQVTCSLNPGSVGIFSSCSLVCLGTGYKHKLLAETISAAENFILRCTLLYWK